MKFLTVCLLFLLIPLGVTAGPAEDWRFIISLDAGPKRQPTTREEAILLARSHLLDQRKAVERFLARYPEDPLAFDAKLKLARILAAEGMIAGDTSKVEEALRLFGELERTPGIARERLADAGFARVSLSMQNQNGSPAQIRDSIVASARNFTAKYPGDRRGPRLLVEAATVCDDSPSQKRDVLEEALRLTDEEALKRRISDDFRRLDSLGKPLELKLAARDGSEISLTKLHGYVVVLIFWSASSPHSLLWLRDFRTAWENLPRDQLRVVTVSLDESRRMLDSRLRELHANWPTHFDGMGWRSPVARRLGINALPSVWILDRRGIVRTINARSSYQEWIRQLLREGTVS